IFQVCTSFSELSLIHSKRMTLVQKEPNHFQNYSNQTPLSQHSNFMVYPFFFTHHLQGNNIGDEGAKSFSDSLKSNTTLTTLDISRVSFLFQNDHSYSKI